MWLTGEVGHRLARSLLWLVVVARSSHCLGCCAFIPVLEYAGFVCLSPPRPCTQSGPLSSPPLALLTAHTLVCVGLWLTGGLMRSHVGVCLSVERCCRPRWPPPKDCPNTCAYRYVVRNDQAPNHQSLLGRFLSAFLVWAHK